MDVLSHDECRKITKTCLGTSEAEILSCDVKYDGDPGSGFLGGYFFVEVTASYREKIVNLNFFVKTLPNNLYHRNNVLVSKIFYKEVEFFQSVLPRLSKYFAYKIAPTCYHADADKFLVLENLSAQGYKNYNPLQFFDVTHCKAVLSRLASFHASSFLYEKEVNSTLDELYPHLCYDEINWFKNEKGHPGYEHCQTGVRALGVILDNYFGHVENEVRERVKILLASNPSLLLKSNKFRNALNHADSWCNNLMFKYNENNEIEDTILVDYQLFGYCPPSTDVYCFLFLSTSREFLRKHLDELTDFYFAEFKACVETHNENPDEFLTREEFYDSVCESLPVALTTTAISLHYVLLPREVLNQVFRDNGETKNFMENDRSSFVLWALEKNECYRNRVLESLSNCIDYVSGSLLR